MSLQRRGLVACTITRMRDFRLVAWDWFGPVPAVCVERPRYDFDLETIDLPRRGMTGARTALDRPTGLAQTAVVSL